MLNLCQFIGNLGQDPELRNNQGGDAICTLRIACTEKYKGRDGDMQERTEWVSVVVFGRQAEAVHKYTSKGKQVYVSGRLQTRKWTDKNGQDRYTTEVVANDVKFLGSAGGGGQRDQGGPRGGGSSGGARGGGAQQERGGYGTGDGGGQGGGEEWDVPF